MAIALAQDSIKHEITIYTFVLNQVPENFKYPAVGVINLAEGNQKGLQLGFSNINYKNFEGAQIGFTNAIGGKTKGAQIGFVNASKTRVEGVQVGYVNMAGKNVKGMQIGFVNASKDELEGAQIGFVNLTGKYLHGPQIGYINITRDSFDGAQLGFVNLVGRSVNGPQIGFVNACKDSLAGAQIGYVNVAGNKVTGSQIGFVNVAAKAMKGSQIGFVNIVDSIYNGVPLGFVSFVNKGGFKAIELGFTSMYPYNASVKFGVPKFYTSFGISWNPDFKNQFAYGYGLGTNLHFTKSLAFNPEATIQHSIANWDHHFLSLSPQLAYTFSRRISVVAGPTIVWQHVSRFKHDDVSNPELFTPSFSFYDNKIDDRNTIHCGLKASLRFHFN